MASSNQTFRDKMPALIEFDEKLRAKEEQIARIEKDPAMVVDEQELQSLTTDVLSLLSKLSAANTSASALEDLVFISIKREEGTDCTCSPEVHLRTMVDRPIDDGSEPLPSMQGLNTVDDLEHLATPAFYRSCSTLGVNPLSNPSQSQEEQQIQAKQYHNALLLSNYDAKTAKTSTTEAKLRNHFQKGVTADDIRDINAQVSKILDGTDWVKPRYKTRSRGDI